MDEEKKWRSSIAISCVIWQSFHDACPQKWVHPDTVDHKLWYALVRSRKVEYTYDGEDIENLDNLPVRLEPYQYYYTLPYKLYHTVTRQRVYVDNERYDSYLKLICKFLDNENVILDRLPDALWFPKYYILRDSARGHSTTSAGTAKTWFCSLLAHGLHLAYLFCSGFSGVYKFLLYQKPQPLPQRLMRDIRRRKNIDAVRLLEQGADSNSATNENWTCLMAACMYGNTEAVKLLLSRGAAPDATTRSGLTALIVAVIFGNYDCVEELVTSGADVNSKEAMGYTALMVAASTCQLNTVRYLLDHDADHSNLSKDLLTALRCAEKYGCTSVANLLHQFDTTE